MGKVKTIYCPKCGRIIAHYDGKSQNDIHVNCRNCKKRVIYHYESDSIEVKKIPKRATCTGVRFY